MVPQTVFETMIAQSDVTDERARLRAIREAMQKIALVGLQRGGFFSDASFYGGTCLSLFYGLPRFSEDMDFSLLRAHDDWSIDRYFEHLSREFEAAGLEVDISRKTKTTVTRIESAFLKSDTTLYQIAAGNLPQMKIKLEVDTDPPMGFETEYRLLMQPHAEMIRCFTLPDLFAGKVHALLYRAWRSRVKGRDWFDFAWFVQQEIPLNLTHLQKRIEQSDTSLTEELTDTEIRNRLRERIVRTDFDLARKDVAPFIDDQHVLDIWSKEYFTMVLDFMHTTTQA